MRTIILVCCAVVTLADFGVSQDNSRQQELARLLIERSKLQEQLAQQPEPEIAASLREQLGKIESKISGMGIDIPSSPEPPVSVVDSTDLPVRHRPPLSREGKPYVLYLALSSQYNDNYFQAVAGTSPQAAWITSVSSSFMVALARNGDRQFTIGAELEHNLFRDIPDADWNVFRVDLTYAIRNHRFSVRGFHTPERLTFITGDNRRGLARTSGIGMDYNGRWTRRMRARLFYRLNDVRYPGFEDRDLKANFFAGDAQYQVHDLFIPGIGVDWTTARTQYENYDYREISPMLMVSARFGRRANLNLRYRYRIRTYPVGDIRASNFGRKDRRHDAYGYAGITLGKHLDLILFGSYLQNLSSRDYRSFDAFTSGVIFQFRLPSR